MIKRLLGLLLLLGAFPRQASAMAYGGWYGRATLDGWHDDNLARQDTPLPEFFPKGNEDAGAELSVSLGSVFLFGPDLDLWLTGSGSGSLALLYPALDSSSAALFADLDWHGLPGMAAYASVGSSFFYGGSPFYIGEVGLEHQLWPGAWLTGAANWGYSDSGSADFRYSAPGAALGLQQGFATGTRLGLSYGVQQRRFGSHNDLDHEIYAIAEQRLSDNWELRARYAYDIVVSDVRGYRNGIFTMGLAFSL